MLKGQEYLTTTGERVLISGDVAHVGAGDAIQDYTGKLLSLHVIKPVGEFVRRVRLSSWLKVQAGLWNFTPPVTALWSGSTPRQRTRRAGWSRYGWHPHDRARSRALRIATSALLHPCGAANRRSWPHGRARHGRSLQARHSPRRSLRAGSAIGSRSR